MPKDRPDDTNRFIEARRLETAQNAFDQNQMIPDPQKIDQQIGRLKIRADKERDSGDIRNARRLACRARALQIFKAHGLNPEKLIARTDLTDHYEGKILLLFISSGTVRGRVCLRSGDGWAS